MPAVRPDVPSERERRPDASRAAVGLLAAVFLAVGPAVGLAAGEPAIVLVAAPLALVGLLFAWLAWRV